MSATVFSADQLCVAAEEVLRERIPVLIEELELDPERYKPFENWYQLPTTKALQDANLPAGAITTAGFATPPQRQSYGYDLTWRLAVGVYARGWDWSDTAAQVRTWAALVRTVLLDAPTLGGVVNSVELAGEEYAELSKPTEARTLGGCAVAFDVLKRRAVDRTDPTWPVVSSTPSSVTVRPPS